MDITNRELLYKIVRARDKRYDGRFYCGVRTTGIYCRPICPARPKLENIIFFRSATEAEKEGFRPCLRCRPDLAPNSVQWGGTAAVVGRALALISRGEVDEIPLARLADKLGVSDRHLRRLFEEHLGASPVEVAASKRLHLAKQLLAQSNLSVTDVAFASGFRSVRRFNEAFKDRFRLSPTEVRRTSARFEKGSFIEIALPVIAPYDWSHIFDFLRRHQALGVESFGPATYRRSFAIEDSRGAIELGFDPGKEELRAKLSISDPRFLREAIERVRDLFDTRLNPHLQEIPERGIRVPGAWDPFETSVSIILGQLVSVEQAKIKTGRLIERFGRKLARPVLEGCTHLFPTPEVLAKASFKEIGITRVRENAIRELARLVLEKRIELSRSSDIQETRRRLLAIPGIGPWTVEMIAMRCLGDSNAFPKTDLIIKRVLERHHHEKGDWSPWNAYVALALWKKYAAPVTG